MYNQIIARKSPVDMKPVVFIIDSYSREEGKIDLWTEQNGVTTTTISFYGACLPLSHADELEMKARFIYAMKQSDVELRFRLPRQSKVRPNIVAPANIVAEQPAKEASPEANKTPNLEVKEIVKEEPKQEKPQQASQKGISANFSRRKYDRKHREEKRPIEPPKPVGIDVEAALKGLQSKFELEIAHLLKIIQDNGFDIPSQEQTAGAAQVIKH